MESLMMAALVMIGTLIEWLIWGTICVGLLLGLLLRIGEAVHHVLSWLWRQPPHPHSAHPHLATFLLAGILGWATLVVSAPAAAQGWWWGSPINPGYDRNTVIQVIGTVTQVNIVSRGGPSTLRLETSGETFTVMLGPGWYLAELHADIRSGDILTVEGSKMMDRWGQLHLAAARIANQRTGTVLELRDETGRPRWMGGGPSGRLEP
jgi:hypothetical protein